jgi:hypothetical protein
VGPEASPSTLATESISGYVDSQIRFNDQPSGLYHSHSVLRHYNLDVKDIKWSSVIPELHG